jgi:hypothetical protein
MNYTELIQLYFERGNSMQAYWNLYVIIIGGLPRSLHCANSLRRSPPHWSRFSSPCSRIKISMPCTMSRRSGLLRFKRSSNSIRATRPFRA